MTRVLGSMVNRAGGPSCAPERAIRQGSIGAARDGNLLKRRWLRRWHARCATRLLAGSIIGGRVGMGSCRWRRRTACSCLICRCSGEKLRIGVHELRLEVDDLVP